VVFLAQATQVPNLTTRPYYSKHSLRVQERSPESFLEITKLTIRTPRPAIIHGAVAKLPMGVGAKDGYALIDAGFAWLDKYKWHYDGRYPATRLFPENKKVRLHHFIVGKHLGMDVDHINQNPLDNRSINLRVVSHAQNLHNNKGVGAYLDKRDRRWFSSILIKNKRVYLGSYKSPQEASRAYQRAKKEAWDLLT
jgi:hypothetical protein